MISLLRNVVLVTVFSVLAPLSFAETATDQTKNNAQATDANASPVVVMTTSMGVIKIELFANEAPITVKNFLQYVEDGFYDGTVFHRIIPYFMIQGGGMNAEMNRQETREPIINEASNGIPNIPGTLAMARTQNPNSATSQFFINVGDNKHLNYSERNAGYAVFGKVISGMNIAYEISNVPTGNYDIPVKTVLINSMKLEDTK